MQTSHTQLESRVTIVNVFRVWDERIVSLSLYGKNVKLTFIYSSKYKHSYYLLRFHNLKIQLVHYIKCSYINYGMPNECCMHTDYF